MKVIRNLAFISAACLAFSGTVPFVPAVPAAAVQPHIIREGECGDHLKWEVTDGGELIISGTGSMFRYGDPDQPDDEGTAAPWGTAIRTVELKSGVTSVGANAFRDCAELEQVTLPDTVTEIGAQAFRNCGKLVTLRFPKNVASLSGGIVSGCTKLKTIEIMNPEAEIADDAFDLSGAENPVAFCGYRNSTTELFAAAHRFDFVALRDEPTGQTETEQTLCGENVTWKLEDGTLTISGKGDMYDYVNPPHYVTLVKGQHTENITPEEQAELDGIAGLFGPNEVSLSLLPWGKHLTEIKKIVIEDGVTGIGKDTFSDCSCAESITIADSVTEIRDRAFAHCQCLQSLKLPKNLKTVGEYAFSQCGSCSGGLDQIELPAGTESIGMEAFSYCVNLTAVTLPDTVQYVGSRAFDGTKWLDYRKGQEQFVIEGGVLLGYGGRFEDELVIPDGVRVIGGGALEYAAYHSNGKNPVLKITVPEGVETLCDFAFCWCGEAQEIELPSTLKTIHDSAFFNCFDLKAISLPEGVETIGKYAFGNCENLTEITVPKSVTELGAGALERCDRLQTVTILNPEMIIGDSIETITNGNEPETFTYNGVIRGYAGSTAEAYAKKYGRKFEVLSEEQTAPAPSVTTGDVNCDQKIDVSDAVLLARFLTADKDAVVTETGIQHADVDKNGKQDSDDLTMLLRFIAKKIMF